MADTYTNPVYPHAAPDPFVLKFRGEYWCYATGLREDGGAFTVLHSPDLVHWREHGPAMSALPGGHTCYWAPEVVYWNGVFYFYYSVGNEETMVIRVAAAPTPGGPFVDQGVALTSEPFAIDPHVYIEGADRWYFFYATDFLTHNFIGTGTVVDRMEGPLKLAGQARPVTRARYDWQVYDPARKEKGGVRWHTVEGSFVLKHGGLYYQMFSGGNWQNLTYGVAYGVTDDIDSTAEWRQPCDGVNKKPVLMSAPERGVIGPGHNSAVRSPNNRELFCVYHRWDPLQDARVLAIDRMGWEGEDLKVYGPSSEPQPVPARPDFWGLEPFTPARGRMEPLEENLWRLVPAGGEALALLDWPYPALLLEATFRMVEDGEAGALLRLGQGEVRLSVRAGEVVLAAPSRAVRTALPKGYDPHAFHLLRVEVTPAGVECSVDGSAARLSLPLSGPVTAVGLWSNAPAEFSGVELTR